MKLFPRRPLRSVTLVSVLAGILVLLAALQYRWIGQVSEADRERLQTRLETSVDEFRLAFNRELLDVGRAFRRFPIGPEQRDWSYFASAYEDWLLTTLYPELVANLFVWEAARDREPRLLQFNQTSGEFEPSASPGRMDAVVSRRGLRRGGREIRPSAWVLTGETPLLVQALTQREPLAGFSRRGTLGTLATSGYFIIELNLDFLRTELLPELAGRYFGGARGLDYHVAVLMGSDPGSIVYTSDEALPAAVFSSSDARVNLLFEFGQAAGRGASDREAQAFRGARGFGRMLPALGREEDSWELAVKHREGSLGEAVERLRRRNLAVSFGVLLLLGVSTAMIVVSTQRAQRLARLRMQFVAGVSHELRTPLAVICSAGDNLADGVVEETEQVRKYGALIRDEGRRLAGMVEQTLQFAAVESGRKRYDLQPVDVGNVIETTLAEAEPMIQAAGFAVEKTIEAKLPLAKADASALSQCIQNLITNALKYGLENRWMGVRAAAVTGARGPEVRITVEDKGAGIEPADLPHIFEPFYQGRAAGRAKSPGAGLGLSLAKDAMEAMGGSISVKGAPGEGSSFSLHLPALGRDRTE